VHQGLVGVWGDRKRLKTVGHEFNLCAISFMDKYYLDIVKPSFIRTLPIVAPFFGYMLSRLIQRPVELQ
jgi:hypothetical protein